MLLKGQSDTKTSMAAKEFLDFLLRGDNWGMLGTTANFEKNRVEAERFFKDLKYGVAQYLRKNTKKYNAVAISKFYTELCNLEKSLTANINLNLLFCTLISAATEIMNNSQEMHIKKSQKYNTTLKKIQINCINR